MESRAALAGNSVFHNKKISFKLVIPPSCFHTLALGDFLIFDVAYTFETQTNAIGLQEKQVQYRISTLSIDNTEREPIIQRRF